VSPLDDPRFKHRIAELSVHYVNRQWTERTKHSLHQAMSVILVDLGYPPDYLLKITFDSCAHVLTIHDPKLKDPR